MLPIKGSISSSVIVPTGQEQGQYKRAGIFHSLSGHLGSKEGTERLAEALLNPGYYVGTDAFASFIENSRYEKEHLVSNIVCFFPFRILLLDKDS